MRNLKCLGIVIALFLTLNTAKSQTISEIISNQGLNYFQMLDQVEENKAILLDSADAGVQKRYYRWRWFWDTRIDTKGSFATYGNQLQQYSENYTPNKSPNNYWKYLGQSE